MSKNVHVWEENVTIPTYKVYPPEKGPLFIENRAYQGSSGKVYPLPVTEKISDKKEDVFVSMPLLYEINFQKHLDKVIAVYSNRDKQIERLTKRDNISYEYAIKKIESQYPQEKKVELADYVIDNSLSKEETIKNIEKIIERMRKDNGN